MTLIELLIVLGLMAAIASVALTTLDGMGDRTRADTTRNRLDMIEQAIIGDGLAPGRFVGDMGRLPVVHLYPDPANQTPSGEIAEGQGLIELWDDMQGVYDYRSMAPVLFNGFDAASGAESEPFYDSRGGTYLPCRSSATTPTPLVDPNGFRSAFPDVSAYTHSTQFAIDVSLIGGWHGPYLQVAHRLFDGFGNAFRMTQVSAAQRPDFYASNNTVWHSDASVQLNPLSPTDALDDAEEIAAIASYGRDAASGGSEWAEVDDVRYFSGSQARSRSATLIVSIKAYTREGWQSPDKDAPILTTFTEPHSPMAIVAKDTPVRLFQLLSNQSISVDPSMPTVPASPWPIEGLIRYAEEIVTAASWDIRTWAHVTSCERMNRMRVLLFAPFADPDYTSNPSLSTDGATVVLGALRIRRIAAWYDWRLTNPAGENEEQGCIDSEHSFFGDPAYAGAGTGREVEFQWTEAHTVEIRNLPPGMRKLYAYGYYTADDSTYVNAHSSGLHTIELRPGVNHITAYLAEPLAR